MGQEIQSTYHLNINMIRQLTPQWIVYALIIISLCSSCSIETYRVIIPVDKNPLTQFENVSIRIDLSEEDLLRIDKICSTKGTNFIEGTNKEFDTYFKNYTRQYYGFIGSDNDKWAIVNLLNFKGINKEYYPNWESELILGLGDFYEINTRRFYVNITNEEIMNY